MKDRGKTKKQLRKKLNKLRGRLAALERQLAENRPAEPSRPMTTALADLVFILDPDGRFVAAAGPWLEKFGLTADWFLGKMAHDFVRSDAAALHERLYRRALSGREVVYDYRWDFPPLPEARHFQAALAPLRDAAGASVGVVGVGNDLTEGVRLGERRAREQKLEALGRMAGGLAHHFNNQLTIILGFSELLLRGMRPDEPARELADKVREAAGRAAALLRPLQAFAGAQSLTPRALDLNALIENLNPSLQTMLGGTIQLVFAPGSELWPIQADPGPLGQVIVNLALNARDAMPEGGTLTIATANAPESDLDRLFMEAIPLGSAVVLTVTDTGAGMSAEVRDRLFEPFFTTKGLSEGPGLGLATVYGIVRHSGGHIEVSTQPGRGTIFAIYLPRS